MKILLHHAKRHYHAKYRERYARLAHWVFLFDSVLVGIILALLGTGAYFAFVYHPLRDDFRFEVVTPEELVAGRETAVKIRVSNVGERRLRDARIRAHLPKHFRISEYPAGHEPETDSTPVGELAPGQTVELSMRGTILGPPGEETVFVHMTASDEGGDPDERIVPVRVAWTGNLFGLELGLPDAVVDGQAVHAKLRVINGTDHLFDDVKILPEWPGGFRILASTPPILGGAISTGPVAAGESVEIEVYGRYRGTSGSFDASAEAFWTAGEERILLARTVERRSAVVPGLEFVASLGPSNLKPQASNLPPGAEVPFVIRYRNAGGYVLKDVRFEVPLDTRVADPGASSVTFEAVPEIKPGDAGELSGSIRLRETFSPYVTDAKLPLVPQATFSIAEPAVAESTVAGTAVEAKIRGQAKLIAAARYYTSEGDQIGRGPLPPRVGKETRYWVFVSLESGASRLTGARAEISLPPGVRWTGRASVNAGESPAFDAERRMMAWDIGDVAAHAGASSDAPTASFEIALTPSESQIGSSPALLSGVSFESADAWTGETLSASHGALTTALPNDPYAAGRSAVRP